ncbi:MAG: hypothetical protein A2452_04955 [Candidatus Firestonebacteria bacterium RIFOXYC2_FULL_39_67]|nr:MAG: hypothetical protein A2536_11490 [Candidatus Firestonebacteria bacterium RIFOXYD2_FULL_39_29]OGF55825.1 MAG: hypothetical protein A2452_04955 [Candidatus Firestonebacteria bacterium RIFOXYC2_FULL_39_67]
MKNNRNTMFKGTLIALNIVLCSIAVGFLFNAINPFGLEIKKSTITQKIIIYKDGKIIDAEKNIVNHDYTNELEYLDLRMAKLYYDEERAVFIDARTSDIYSYGHIRGAISLPVGSFEEQYKRSKVKIDKGFALIVYCSSSFCPLSERVAILLKLKGHKNIKVYSGGWGEWSEARYPTEKGTNEKK